MSVKCTYTIDRDTAISVIINNVYSCSNEQISSMLENVNESPFRNYRVCNELSNVNCEVENYFMIKNIEEF